MRTPACCLHRALHRLDSLSTLCSQTGGLLVDVPLQATQSLVFLILLSYGSVIYSVVSFKCTAKYIRNTDTYIYIFSDSFFHYRLLQVVEY